MKIFVDLYLQGQKVGDWRYRSLIRAVEVVKEVQDIVAQRKVGGYEYAEVGRSDAGPFIPADDAKLRVIDAGRETCSA
jgi:hypothetical protein